MSSKVFSTSFSLDPTLADPNPNLMVTHRDGAEKTEIKPKGKAVSIRWTEKSALYVFAVDLTVIRLGGDTLLDDFEKANSSNSGLLGHDWSENRTCEITLTKDSDDGPYKFTTTFTAKPITWSDIASRVWSREPVSPDDS